ncbi:MAG: RNA-binding S4 domain-containing protein [Erysipelothrix sp.]|nr:RNA-binding S4 domain-containing protein [Erysipelothrix sp.]
MRLDKYLKVSRVIKRRTVAKDLADDDRVFVNDRLAKPSTDVQIGDEVEIQFEHRHIRLKIEYMSEKMHKDAQPYFELIFDKSVSRKTDLTLKI